MNEKFIVDRITQLRMAMDISEYQLSHDLGRSRSYFNNISRGENLLSMSAFLELCDYFKISPAEFFLPALEKLSEKNIHKYLKLSDKHREEVNDVIEAFLAKQVLEEQGEAPDK